MRKFREVTGYTVEYKMFYREGILYSWQLHYNAYTWWGLVYKTYKHPQGFANKELAEDFGTMLVLRN